ncbi:hypothetical protein NDU88_004120 [Pleurodeles waltl]|uniref:Uncharacterized protein n=1 Tax=Pleurodeles waltl TaxID=8319 RepID=A0AAV7V3I2_PLEWA|nr:hypothetical protein NDU88_004120 [Pleurodeles waltl]
MARDDPGSAAGRRPLTGAGVRSLWEAPPRGGFLPPGDFPLRPSGRPADLRGIVGHPPSLHPAAQGGRGEAPVPCGTCGLQDFAPRDYSAVGGGKKKRKHTVSGSLPFICNRSYLRTREEGKVNRVCDG